MKKLAETQTVTVEAVQGMVFRELKAIAADYGVSIYHKSGEAIRAEIIRVLEGGEATPATSEMDKSFGMHPVGTDIPTTPVMKIAADEEAGDGIIDITGEKGEQIPPAPAAPEEKPAADPKPKKPAAPKSDDKDLVALSSLEVGQKFKFKTGATQYEILEKLEKGFLAVNLDTKKDWKITTDFDLKRNVKVVA